MRAQPWESRLPQSAEPQRGGPKPRSDASLGRPLGTRISQKFPGLRPRCYIQVGIALLAVQLASLGSKNKVMVHRWSHWFAAIYASAHFIDPEGRQTLCRCAQATG